MTPAQYATVIRREGAALLAAARRDPTASIPRYAAWTMIDLVVHTGSVHRRTSRIVRELRTEHTDRVYPPSEDVDVVLPWFEEGVSEMAGLLEGADPAVPVWGFGPSPTIGFWQRRMALETAIHRWDAESAFGRPRPLEPDLAAEGIDEYVVMHVPHMTKAPAPRSDVSLTLRASDAAASWQVRFTDTGVSMARGDGGDATLTGTASDLYLELMGRGPDVASSAEGDAAAVAAWREAVAALPDATR